VIRYLVVVANFSASHSLTVSDLCVFVQGLPWWSEWDRWPTILCCRRFLLCGFSSART